MSGLTKIICVLALIWVLVCGSFVYAQPQRQSVCGVQTLYFQHNESTSPPGYEELINYPSGNPEVDENITIKNTDGLVLIDNYIMPEGSLSGTTALLDGLRRYRFYSYVDGASGVTTLNFTAFRRYADGTEQNFYSAQSEDINSLTVLEYDLNYVSQNVLYLNPTDRLGIRVYGMTTHSAPIKLHWVYQGASHASHFESGYFVCPTPEAVGLYTEYERAPISPVIPCIALIVSMIVIGGYSNSRRKQP